MNLENQQEEQLTDAEVAATGDETTESSQQEVNESEQNADVETDDSSNLDEHLATFEAMEKAQQEAASDLSAENPKTSPETEQAPSEPPAVDNGPPDARIDAMWENFQQDLRKRTTEDLNNAVNTVKDTSPILKGMPDYVVKGALEELNRQDPRIGRAFSLRHEDSKLWGLTLKEIGKRLASDLGTRPDGEASDNVSAVRASVNSQSSGSQQSGLSDEEVNALSDAEFDEYLAKEYDWE